MRQTFPRRLSQIIALKYCQYHFSMYQYHQQPIQTYNYKMTLFWQENQKLKYYGAYTLSYLAYGIILLSIGPLIPFLAVEAGLLETEYSFLYTCRASGMLIGAAIMSYFQSKAYKPTMNQFLIISSIVIAVTNLLFIWSNSPFQQGLWVFIGSIGYFLLEISINISVIIFSDKKDVEFWLMFINGTFGIGGFIAPILVRYFGISCYYLITIMIGLTIPLYFILPSPEKIKKQEKEQLTQPKTIDKKMEYLLSFMLFIYLGGVVSQGAWSSSYAVMVGISNPSEATTFPTIFFFTVTFCRFAFLLLKLKSSQKLKYSILGVIFFEIFSLVILKYGFVKEALIFNSITIGIFMSSIYALIYSISSEFDQPLTEKQASSIALWGVIGEGVLSPLCAKLMEFIDVNMYFYFIILLYVTMWYVRCYIMKFFSKTSKESSDKEKNLTQMMLTENA